MLQNEKEAFILKKTYEISYAIFRIAPYVPNASLKERLEAQALSLIDAAAMGNYPYASLAARSVEYLVRFGGDTGIINLMNAETIIIQIGALNLAIAESGNAATPREVPLDGIFSEPRAASQQGKEPKQQKEAEAEPSYFHIEHPAIEHPVTEPSGNGNMNGMLKAAMRQSAILERIRQSGNCRLKDIQEILPDCSERTIRYDLQSLLEQNLVERVGSGGPAVYYKVR